MSSARVSVLVRPVLALALTLLCAVSPACGPDDAAVGDGESWPMALGAPGVLAYVAVHASPASLEAFLADQVGWRPGGLADGRPACLLLLDASVMGGDTALCLPIDDEDAFRESLARSERVEQVGDGRFELHLDPDHPLVVAQRAMRSVGQNGASPSALIEALRTPTEFVVPLSLSFHRGFALLAPTYEAAFAARQALDEMPGMLRAESFAAVVDLDLQRLAKTYHKEIEVFLGQLRNARLGAGAAGAAAMFAQGRERDGGGPRSSEAPHGSGGFPGLPELPVSGAFLWTVVDALRVGDLEALQLRVDGESFDELLAGLAGVVRSDDPHGEQDESAAASGATSARELDVSRAPTSFATRLRWAAGSDWTALFGALRPAPEVEGALCVLAADGDAFADAAVRFVQPIAEYVKGEGPPADRFAAQFGELLRAWSGLLAVVDDGHDGYVPALTLRPGVAFDADGARAWLKTLADGAGWNGAPFWETDVEALAAEGGRAWLVFDGALLLADPREAARAEDVARLVRDAADAWTPGDGPSFVVRPDVASLIEAHVEGNDLVVQRSRIAPRR